MKLKALLLLVIVQSFAHAQAPLKKLETPSDAVGWALTHQITLDEISRPFYRYVWIPTWAIPQHSIYKWDERHVAATVSYIINEVISQEGIILQPEVIANGFMVAIDLRRYAPKTHQLQRLVDVWDGGGIDEPFFHITKENLTQIPGTRDEVRVDRDALVAVYSPHIQAQHAVILAQMNLSPMSVIRLDWFVERVLDLKYYEFRQYVKQNGILFNQFEVYKTIGLDEKLVRSVDGDQRAGILISGVTVKSRRVDRLQSPLGRFGTGAVWQTWDIFNESVKTKNNPFYNLLVFNPDAGEAIFELPNGLHGYILYTTKNTRALQRVVPSNVARDSTIPAPHTDELKVAIGCIRCHGENRGLHPINNDVKTLFSRGSDLTFDLSGLGLSQEEVVNELAGLYVGEFSDRLALGRVHYQKAVRRATKMPGKNAGMDIAETSSLVSVLYHNYLYEFVDARQACRELGYEPGKDSISALSLVLNEQQGGVSRNPVIGALLAGLEVRRADWNQVYSAAREAAYITMEKKNENSN
jgi:hypothetical protein